jgi:hypothetical protein
MNCSGGREATASSYDLLHVLTGCKDMWLRAEKALNVNVPRRSPRHKMPGWISIRIRVALHNGTLTFEGLSL